MPSCIVKGCKNSSTKTKGTDIMYFRFPNDPFYCNRWSQACANQNVNISTARICSKHFAENCYLESYRIRKTFGYPIGRTRILKLDAIPTENLPSEFIIDNNDDAASETKEDISEINVIVNELERPPSDSQSGIEILRNECNVLRKEKNLLKKQLDDCETTNTYLINVLYKYFTAGQVKFILAKRPRMQ